MSRTGPHGPQASEHSEVSATEAALAARVAELARSNAELERFAYAASHELQEPLRMVASYLQLIERRYKGRLDADADEFIAFAVDGAVRMKALIDGLLAYARVGSSGSELSATGCDAALDAALENLEVKIGETGAVVTRDPLLVVEGDAAQLARLFQNLVDNALKFRSREPPRIHVGAQREAGWWRISVRDNGIGVDPGQFHRLFELFQRLHGPAEFPGTGIGLAVCKRIVERHGGKIWIESAPGAGATFHFTLPEGRRCPP